MSGSEQQPKTPGISDESAHCRPRTRKLCEKRPALMAPARQILCQVLPAQRHLLGVTTKAVKRLENLEASMKLVSEDQAERWTKAENGSLSPF